MQADAPSDPPESKPFLELGEDLPADWQYHSSASPARPAALPPEWPTSTPSAGNPLLSDQPRPAPSRRWVYRRPNWTQLLGMAVGLAVILALLPQFLGIVGVSLRVLLLTLRILALPLLALGLAWWGWQLWQYRTR